MTQQNSTVVVIPCFNEEQEIGNLVREVRQHVETVIVVDDGSTDSTLATAEKARAKVVGLADNSGKGAALVRGLREAFTLGFDHVVTMDGDGQHDPNDLPAFLELAGNDETDLVVGNRMTNTAEMPWVRRVVNRWMSKRISRIAGRELPDTQCGYRLIRLSAWRKLSFSSTGFEIESEMLLEFARSNKHIDFVPVRTIYKTEQSKIHPVHDTIRWFRWWRHARR